MNNSFSPQDIEKLIALASKKTGADPQKMKEQIQSGKLDKMLENTGVSQNDVSQLLSNPELAKQFLSTPQAMQIIKKLLEG